MGLIDIKCPHCGGNLKINEEAKGALTCMYCGSQYIAEQEIKNYNTIINNTIISDKVVIGKNIDALVKRGIEIINTHYISLKEEQINDLKDIAKGILEQDADNFYGRLFLIAIGDNTIANYEICEKTSNYEQKILFSDYVNSILDIDFILLNSFDLSDELKCEKWFTDHNLDFSFCLKSNYDKILSQSISLLLLTMEGMLKNEIELYNQTIKKIKEYLIKIFDLTSYYVRKFDFKGNFKKVCEIFVTLGKLVEYFDDFIADKQSIYEIGNKILNILESNKKTIMQNNRTAGRELFSSCVLIAGKNTVDFNIDNYLSNLDEYAKHIIEDIYVGNEKAKIILEVNSIVFDINNYPKIQIRACDVLFIHFDANTYSEIQQVIIGFDLLYRIDESHCSLIHYWCKRKLRDYRNCDVYKMMEKWANEKHIKIGDWIFIDNYIYKKDTLRNGYFDMKYVSGTPKFISNDPACYVATCVYGSYDCPEVWRLRRYRDNYLDKSFIGRLFIKLYYSISPKLVKLFGNKEWFKKPIKKILDNKIKKLEQKGYLDTPYNDKY